MTDLQTDEHWIATGRGRLYARRWRRAQTEAASAPPIVLFHDSLGSVELWRDFPEQLVQRTDRTVIAYDRLGFGRSDPYFGRLQTSFICDEVVAGFRPLCEALGITDFVALGHSVGGCMAVSVAARFPDACRALVTESAQAFIEERTLDGIRAARAMFAQPGQLDRLRKYHGDKANWVLEAWVETWLSPEFRSWSLDDSIRQVRCPLLAIHGDRDEYGSVEHPQHMTSLAVSPAQVAIIPDCGHVPHREASDTVLKRVSDWLESLPKSAG